MIGYVLQGAGLGFAGGVQPGPFQTYLIAQTLENGWRRTLPAALAPLISDPPIIALVLLVLSRVPPEMQRFLHLASGAFILYLAYGALARWRALSAGAAPAVERPSRTFVKAVVMNFVSPGPYVYWSLAAGPTFLRGWRDAPACGLGFLGGFYAALIGTFAFTILLFGVARRLGPQVNRALLAISAAALAAFGFFQLWLGAA